MGIVTTDLIKYNVAKTNHTGAVSAFRACLVYLKFQILSRTYQIVIYMQTQTILERDISNIITKSLSKCKQKTQTQTHFA